MDFLNEIPVIGPMLAWTIPFLIVLSVVVAIHELGHLMVGRWCGIKAEVYSIGFGPVIFSRMDRHGTVWQVAALPLGGYVKFLGDMDPASARKGDDSEIPPGDRHMAFHNAALWRRALTVLAGPVANFILSILVIWGLALHVGKMSDEPVIADLGSLKTEVVGFEVGDRILEVGGEPIESFGQALGLLLESDGKPVAVVVERGGRDVQFEAHYTLPAIISGMQADGAALAAGLRVGDLIQRIGDTEIRSLRHLQEVTAELPHHQEVSFQVLRDGEVRTIAFTPNVVERKHPVTGEMKPIPLLGVHLATMDGLAPKMESIGFFEAGERAVWRVGKIITDTMVFIHAMLFRGADTSQLAGPIGIAKHSANAAAQGGAEFIMFMAFVSTAIGLFNLFPIPILDGGHLCFYLYEWVRGRPTNDTVVRYSTMAGLSLLLLLMVFVTFNNDLGLGEWLSSD